MNFAPIGLSTYARLTHLRKTVDALKLNTLAKKSDLFVFSDAAKPGDEDKVRDVRDYLHSISGFKNIYVLARNENNRVRNNRGGISKLLKEYGKCIYLEEDIVTAPGFLEFMNEALTIYENEKDIFSISGYSPPIYVPRDYLNDAFILRRASAWGMGIWHDRFNRIRYLDYNDVIKKLKDDEELKELSKYGEDLLNMILLDASGRIDALDVKIFYYQFLNKKYSIYPRKSLVRNIGLDGSGVHCGMTSQFDCELWDRTNFRLNKKIELDYRIVKSNYEFRKIPKDKPKNENAKSCKNENVVDRMNMGDKIIFLISQPRAGSTLLQRILSGHPDIHSTAEPWVMLHPLYALKKEGLCAEFQSDLYKQGLEDFLANIPEGIELYIEALRKFGNTIYNRTLEVSGKKYFLDKTPRYYLIINELKRVFPKAHFIILLRNPMSVLSSTLKTWFQNDPKILMKSPNFIDVIKGPESLIQGLLYLKEDAIVVKYEDLVVDTEKIVKGICNRLGIDFQNRMLIYGKNPKPNGRFGDSTGIFKHDEAVPNYISKWVKNLKSPDLYEFSLKYMEKLGPDIFKLMGYSYSEIKNEFDKIGQKSILENASEIKIKYPISEKELNGKNTDELIKTLKTIIKTSDRRSITN